MFLTAKLNRSTPVETKVSFRNRRGSEMLDGSFGKLSQRYHHLAAAEKRLKKTTPRRNSGVNGSNILGVSNNTTINSTTTTTTITTTTTVTTTNTTNNNSTNNASNRIKVQWRRCPVIHTLVEHGMAMLRCEERNSRRIFQNQISIAVNEVAISWIRPRNRV